MALSLTFTAPSFLLQVAIVNILIINILIRQLYDCHIRCRCSYSELRKVRMNYLEERFTKFFGPVPSPLGLRDEMFNS